MDGENNTGGFVTEDMIIVDNHGAYPAGVPEVDVRAAVGEELVGMG